MAASRRGAAPDVATTGPRSYVPRMATVRNGRRVAIVAGLRTPFTKSGTTFRALTAQELGKLVVAELVQRTSVEPNDVDTLVFGTVVPSVLAPNIAREVSLLPLLPKGIPAVTVSRACASANQAITDAADQILLGHADIAIAGGAESLSNVPILHSRGFADAVVAASRAKSAPKRLGALARIRPRDLVPVTPAIAEPSTGETMGQSAEKMAKLNHITREEQDQFALRSHRLAAAGTHDGRLTSEMMAVYVPPKFETVSTTDNGIRSDTTLDQMQALKPVFDRRYGTVTAGNSSPLTDGAAAVLLMSEDAALASGYAPLAFIKSYAYAALDPGEQLLMGPVLATPVALDRAGLTLKEIDLVEMHEAFAAQVLSNLQGFESREWAQRAGYLHPVGEVDRARLNVMGGSIAIGHPFGATGARITMTLIHELRRRGGQFGLMTVCAAGGMGFAMVVENAG
jgi:acetyl-CoA acyltransferase